MKTLLLTLLFPVLLKSCEGLPDQTGHAPIVTTNGSGSGGGGTTGSGTDTTTDAPLDGGISILLITGAVYGVRRYRTENKEKKRSAPSQTGAAI